MHIDRIIYNKLVKNDDDILGIIAFGIYKKQETKWIDDFKKSNNGTVPDKPAYISFLRIVGTEQQLRSYKEKATEIAELFAKNLYENELSQIQQQVETHLEKFQTELDTQYEEDFQRATKKFSPDFRTGVYQSIVGSVFFVLLIGLIFFFTWSISKGPKDIIENIFHIKITSVEEFNKKND